MELGCRFLVKNICREMLINAYEIFDGLCRFASKSQAAAPAAVAVPPVPCCFPALLPLFVESSSWPSYCNWVYILYMMGDGKKK